MPLSLEEILKLRCEQNSPPLDLHERLERIRLSAEKIWQEQRLTWFTDHRAQTHSKYIIEHLADILQNLEKTEQRLNVHELYVLLAACYLHDIGMQNYVSKDGKGVEQFSSADYNSIRKDHPRRAKEMILRRGFSSTKDEFRIDIDDDPQYLKLIALVSQGHGTAFFEDSVKQLDQLGYRPGNAPFRGSLLAALLLMGDELDLHERRASFRQEYSYSPVSLLHHYIHSYVTGVEIVSGFTPKHRRIRVFMEFPKDADRYKNDVCDLVRNKLLTQCQLTNDIIERATQGELKWDLKIEINVSVDQENVRRPLNTSAQAPEILEALKKELLSFTPKPEHFQRLGSNNSQPILFREGQGSSVEYADRVTILGKEFIKKELPHFTDSEFVVLSPDNSFFITGSYSGLRVWDMVTHEQIRTLSTYDMHLNGVVISPDGDYCVAADWTDHRILIWEIKTGQLIQVLSGHTDMPLSLAFTADSTTLFSGSKDTTIRAWNWKKGKFLYSYKEHTGSVMKLAVDSKSNYLASISADQTFKLYDISNHNLLFSRTIEGYIPLNMAFTPEGQKFAILSLSYKDGEFSEGCEIRVIDVAELQEAVCVPKMQGRPEGMTFLDTQTLLIGDWSGGLTFLDVSSGREIRQEFLNNMIRNLVWNQERKSLHIAHSEGITLFGEHFGEERDVVQNEVQLLLQHPSEIKALAIDRNSETIAYACSDTVGLLNPLGTAVRHYFQVTQGSATSIALDISNNHLYVSCWSPEVEENCVDIHSITSKTLQRKLTSFPAPVGTLELTSTGDLLAVGLRQRWIKVYATTSQNPLVLDIDFGQDWEVLDLAFCPKDNYLAIALSVITPRVVIYDIKEKKILRYWDRVDLDGIGSWFTSVRWLNQSQIVVGESSGTIRVLDVATGSEIANFAKHTDIVFSLATITEEAWVLSGSWDRTVRLWSITTKQELKRWEINEDILSVVVSKNGKGYFADRSGRISSVDVALQRIR